jgi:hypothetical protein
LAVGELFQLEGNACDLVAFRKDSDRRGARSLRSPSRRHWWKSIIHAFEWVYESDALQNKPVFQIFMRPRRKIAIAPVLGVQNAEAHSIASQKAIGEL